MWKQEMSYERQARMLTVPVATSLHSEINMESGLIDPCLIGLLFVNSKNPDALL